jgi:hypothetical protein
MIKGKSNPSVREHGEGRLATCIARDAQSRRKGDAEKCVRKVLSKGRAEE